MPMLLDLCFDLADALQGLIPASFELIRHQPILRIGSVVLLLRPPRAVPGSLQVALECRQDFVDLACLLFVGHDRCLNRCWLYHAPMDSVESVVATLLGREGFWVRSSFRVELTKAEKVEIGRQSSPRWELDLVAYRALTNELIIVECKSYVDSIGVAYAPIFREGSDPKSRYTPAEKIRAIIETHLFDLVCLGTRGMGAVRNLILGSTTAKVLRAVEVPVLVVSSAAP